MSERPLLPTGEQVRAILDGRKTQHRLPIKLPPGYQTIGRTGKTTFACRREQPIGYLPVEGDKLLRSPFGGPGDVLWCREAWATHEAFDEYPPREVPREERVWYRNQHGGIAEADGSSLLNMFAGRMRLNIHMPCKFARLFLRVKRVWVERVQDIFEHDAEAEGMREQPDFWNPKTGNIIFTHRGAFRHFWDSLYAAKSYGWDENPPVFGCEFERTERCTA